MVPEPNEFQLHYLHEAQSIIKKIGFVLHNVSMQTEACYYEYPGRVGLLRLAMHRQSRHNATESVIKEVCGSINFSANHTFKSEEAVRSYVATRVGFFMMKSKLQDET